MKANIKLRTLLAGLVIMVGLVTSAQVRAQIYAGADKQKVAQAGMAQHKGQMAMIPNLTDEQKAKIKDLMYDNGKEVKLIHARVAEKRAHLRLLTLADNPDMKAIDNTINDMMSLRGDILKHAVSLKFAMKNILNKEQFQAWEMHRQMANKMKGHNFRQNMQTRQVQGQNFRQNMQRRQGQGQNFRGPQGSRNQNYQQNAPAKAPVKNN